MYMLSILVNVYERSLGHLEHMLSPVCNSPQDVYDGDSGSSGENHCRGELFGVGPVTDLTTRARGPGT